MDVLRGTTWGGDKADVLLNVESLSAGANFIGRDSIVANYVYGATVSEALAKKLNDIYDLIERSPEYSVDDATALKGFLEKIQWEVDRGGQASTEQISMWLQAISSISPALYGDIVARLSDLQTMLPPSIRLALNQPQSS